MNEARQYFQKALTENRIDVRRLQYGIAQQLLTSDDYGGNEIQYALPKMSYKEFDDITDWLDTGEGERALRAFAAAWATGINRMA